MIDPCGKVTVLAADGTTVRTATLYGNPWTFTGRRLDQETGLMYYRWRMYSTDLGRFCGRDPIGYRGGGMGLYALPWSRIQVDPYGLGGIEREVKWDIRNVGKGDPMPEGYILSQDRSHFTDPEGTKFKGKTDIEQRNWKFVLGCDECKNKRGCYVPVLDEASAHGYSYYTTRIGDDENMPLPASGTARHEQGRRMIWEAVYKETLTTLEEITDFTPCCSLERCKCVANALEAWAKAAQYAKSKALQADFNVQDWPNAPAEQRQQMQQSAIELHWEHQQLQNDSDAALYDCYTQYPCK
jgi:RHS repeat-associated protein